MSGNEHSFLPESMAINLTTLNWNLKNPRGYTAETSCLIRLKNSKKVLEKVSYLFSSFRCTSSMRRNTVSKGCWVDVINSFDS